MSKSQHLAFYARTACGTLDDLESQFSSVRDLIPRELRHMSIEYYSDIGSGLAGFEPGGNGNVRLGLQKLAEDISRGMVDSVHVLSKDRLARSHNVRFQFAEICHQHRIPIYVGGTRMSRFSHDIIVEYALGTLQRSIRDRLREQGKLPLS